MRDFVKALVVVALVAAPSFGAIDFNLGAGSSTVQAISIPVGGTVTVKLYAQGNTASLKAVGGDIVATQVSGTAPSLQSQNTFIWTPTPKTVGRFGELVPNLRAPGFDGVPDMPYYSGWDSETGEPAEWDPTLNTTLPGNDGILGTPDDQEIVNGYLIGKPKPWPAVIGPNGGAAQLGSCRADLFYQDLNPDFGKTSLLKLGSYTVEGIAPGTVRLDWVGVAVVSGGYGGFYTVTATGDTTLGTMAPLTITVTPEPATMGLLALAGLLIARRRA